MRRLLTALVAVLASERDARRMRAGGPQFACPPIGWIKRGHGGPGRRRCRRCTSLETLRRRPPARSPRIEPQQVRRATRVGDRDTAGARRARPVHPVPPPFATDGYASRHLDVHSWDGCPRKEGHRTCQLSADGTILAEREVKLSWKRVGGSERCGGPVETPPIILSIPG